MLKNLNLLRPILAILILFIPLYPKFPLTAVNNTYVAIRLDDIVVALSLLVWLVYQLKKGFPVFKLKITPLILVYFGAIVLSTLHALLILKTEPTNILFLHLFRRFEYMSLFFLTVSSISRPKDFRFPLVFLNLAAIGVIAYGLGQKYLHWPVISTMNEEFSKGQLLTMNVWTRISSTFAGHYDLAAFTSVALIVLGGAFFIVKKWYQRLILLATWLCLFYVLTLTASRISIFAYWGGILFCLILLKKYLYIFPVSLLVLFSIFNSADLNQRLLATIPAFQKQIRTPQSISPTAAPTPTSLPNPTPVAVIISPVTTPLPTVVRHGVPEEFPPIDVDAGVARSGEIRFNVEWPRAVNAFKRNLLLGSGLGSLSLATDNDYLRLLGESGILGFLSFMVIIIWFFLKSLPSIFKKNRTTRDLLIITFLSAMLAHLANAMFIDVFEASKTAYLFWIMMGIYYQALTLPFKK